jgi:hypothetical protein
MTALSEGVRPGTVALVESPKRANTPSSPYSLRRRKSVGSPMTGVSSIL